MSVFLERGLGPGHGSPDIEKAGISAENHGYFVSAYGTKIKEVMKACVDLAANPPDEFQLTEKVLNLSQHKWGYYCQKDC